MAGGGGLFGGGGSSGASDATAAAARQEALKQEARNAVNAAFGIAPSLDGITPGALSSTSGGLTFNPVTGQVKGGGLIGTGSTIFNPGAGFFSSFGNAKSFGQHTDYTDYNNAIADYKNQLTQADTNKSARDALYDQVRTDAYNAGKTNLDDTKTTATRNNKFALFAQGLNGGSQDIDESALLDRTYTKALLDLGAKADSARSGLQSNDETTRLGLLQAVDNGMNTSDALTSALTQMKTGADKAEADAEGTNLGDLFAQSGALYTKSNAARGAQAGLAYLNSQYPQGASLSGGKSGGIVTSTGS